VTRLLGTMTALVRRTRMLFRRRQVDHELDEEMRLHVDLRQRRLESAGMAPDAARRHARRRFGSPVRHREAAHDALGWRSLDELRQDLRHSLRALLHDRAFAITVTLTLALGIGATAAIFSLLDHVVLRPLPFERPDRLVQLYGTPATRGESVDGLDDYRDRSTSFEALAGYSLSARYLRLDAEPQRVMTVRAERSLFSLLGVEPILGHTFAPDDSAAVAVVSRRFWEERLGGDPGVLGRTLTLDNEPFAVIGVMPASFQFPYSAASSLPGVVRETRTDLWVLWEPPADPGLRARPRFSYVTGRLREPVTFEAAASELALIDARLQAERLDPYGPRGVRLERLDDVVTGPTVRRPLVLMFVAVTIVLLLTCVNVANLALMRALSRRRDLTVRAALGAGPLRLVRLCLVESLQLAGAGGLVGLMIAWWGSHRLGAMLAAQVPRAGDASVDWRVALFLAVVCTGTGLLFGLAPAVMAGRTNARAMLADADRQGAATFGRFRDALVAIQIGLAFVLAAGAGALIRDLYLLRATDSGMVTANVITFHLGERLDPALRNGAGQSVATGRFYEIADRARQLPGVQAAGITQVLPLQNWGWTASSADFRLRGQTGLAASPFAMHLRYVTDGYFRALGIPIRAGRAFTPADTASAPPVILVNETLARLRFGNTDPIGLETNRGRIVGVVADVRQVHLATPAEPELYYPIAQNWSQVDDLGMTLVVRHEGAPGPLVAAIRRAVRDVNANLAMFDVKSMDEVVTDSLATFLPYLWLMTAFAVVGLTLAATGTYGLIAYVGAARRRECAIRGALGADQRRLVWLMLRRGILITVVGLVSGLVAAGVAAPLLQTLPVSVSPPGIAMSAAVAVLLAVVATAACLLPTYRASTVDPMVVLRND